MAWLFMLAEPRLHDFAKRIADDLPDDLAVMNPESIYQHLITALATSTGSDGYLTESGGVGVNEEG